MAKGKLIGQMKNNWRKRMVYVYEDTEDNDSVFTVGKPFGGGADIETHEKRDSFKRTINKFPVMDVYN